MIERVLVVTVFKKTGDRVDPGLQKIGQEGERHEDERDRRHPLVAGDGDAQVGRGLAGHADKLFRRDVRRDQRDADQPPGQSAPRQKIIGGAALFTVRAPAFPETDTDHRRNEPEKNRNVHDTHDLSLLTLT